MKVVAAAAVQGVVVVVVNDHNLLLLVFRLLSRQFLEVAADVWSVLNTKNSVVVKLKKGEGKCNGPLTHLLKYCRNLRWGVKW
jgi:hypothetical protein